MIEWLEMLFYGSEGREFEYQLGIISDKKTLCVNPAVWAMRNLYLYV